MIRCVDMPQNQLNQSNCSSFNWFEFCTITKKQLDLIIKTTAKKHRTMFYSKHINWVPFTVCLYWYPLNMLILVPIKYAYMKQERKKIKQA